MPIMLTLRMLREDDHHKFKASLFKAVSSRLHETPSLKENNKPVNVVQSNRKQSDSGVVRFS